MKLISFIVPCYNSAAYMQKCLDSILSCEDFLQDIDLIIVDDGSQKDNTLEIAKTYAARYPGSVRALHQENGGHGEAINTGLRHARGRYVKVVDSDDWLDQEALPLVLGRLRRLTAEKEQVDLFVANYVYDKLGQKHKKVMRYTTAFPQNRIFGWKDVKHFRLGQYILMHSVIYRTKLLRHSGIHLPKHTFYVDNYFVYQPLPYVKKLYYMDLALYHYYIGREDQSVHESVMIGRLDQQVSVNRRMLECCDLHTLRPRKLQKYMFSYLEIMTTISSILALKSGTEQNLAMKRVLWEYIRNRYPWLWRKLRFGLLGILMNLPGKSGRRIAIFCYQIAQKLYGFN